MSVAVTMFERLPAASLLWITVALRLALSKGSGMPAEIRLRALGARAFVNNEGAVVFIDDDRSRKP